MAEAKSSMGEDFSPAGSFNKDSEKINHAEQLDGPVPVVSSEADALRIAKEQHWKADQFIEQMEQELEQAGYRNGRLGGITFKNPKHFTWAMVFFASMGGMLFGLDQSLISGANLFLPDDLGFTTRQVSLVNSSMPLGAVAGAILLSPTNEWFGRRGAIILATILYTLGAALEAGAINYGMMVTARLILGLGVGIETGTVPIYVAESVERRLRGNLVSLYQFNIALGEVLGFVVAAIFLKVKGNWRYILGSSVVFSIIMFTG
jgi:Na+/melibiose symporter-like transporter